MKIFDFIKKFLKKSDKKENEKLYKVQATPERIELKKKIDATIHCEDCGRPSGKGFGISLRKKSKAGLMGKGYICSFCYKNININK